MSKRVSRRDFARTSVAAGAAAVALPGALLGKEAATELNPTAIKGAAVAAARRRRIVPPPPNFSYGGDAASAVAEYRDSISLAHAPALARSQSQTPRAPVVIGNWREGMTIPGEYYVEEKHYLSDERFLGEHLWFMADHVSRIPKPGDYFLFEYGRGESVIILRDKAGEVKGYQNVCRHRGSRLCRHDESPAPKDARLSVLQLGSSGNTPVFRCPYHAWTYDLDGKLISAPNGMPGEWDMTKSGLLPAHLRISEGFIFVNFAKGEPPDFDSQVKSFATVAKEYGTADLKRVAQASAPTKANWKLVLENFQECYHCAPAHRSLVTTHPFWDGMMPAEQRERLAKQLEKFIPPRPAGQGGMSMGQGLGGNILNVNMVSGTLDGKAVGPLLPDRKEWTHRSRAVSTGWSTGYLQCYDDHVACVRFTPRDTKYTDAELFWLVGPDSKPKDIQIEKMKDLWTITYLEDRWITENNHDGIESGSYMTMPYAAVETGPTRFVTWYMQEAVSAARATSDAG